MDVPQRFAVKVKKTARKSGPRCRDIPGKQLAWKKQWEANLREVDAEESDLSSLEQSETAIPIPHQTSDFPNGLEAVRDPNPVSTPSDKILLSPSSTVSTFETVKSISGAYSSIVEKWSSLSALNTVPFITKMTADLLSDAEQIVVSPCHISQTAYKSVPLPFQTSDKGGEVTPLHTSEIYNVGKSNTPPVLTPIHSSKIYPVAKRDTPPVLTPNSTSGSCIVAKENSPSFCATVVSTSNSLQVERDLFSHLNADCPSSPPPVERKLISHLNTDSPSSPITVETSVFSHINSDSPATPAPFERTSSSSSQLQYLPPERKLFSHLKDDSSFPPERKLFSHLKDDLQSQQVPLSPERKLFAHLNVDSSASPEESDGDRSGFLYSYTHDLAELKRVRVVTAESPDIPDSPEVNNTLSGSLVSVGSCEETEDAPLDSDFQARFSEEDNCESQVCGKEISQRNKGASAQLVMCATGAGKTQIHDSCDTAVVNSGIGATKETLEDLTFNPRSDQTAPVSKEIPLLESNNPVAPAALHENIVPNTSSTSSVASAPTSSVKSHLVSVSHKETNSSHSREFESTSGGIENVSTGSTVSQARDPRKKIPSRAPVLFFHNGQVNGSHPSPRMPQGKETPGMDSQLRNQREHSLYPSHNGYFDINSGYNSHGTTSGQYNDYFSSPHSQYSGIPSYFNMCDAQGNVYGFYTGYDVQGHLTAYPDPAYYHPQVDPAKMFYCDSLGNILQDQSGPPPKSSQWEELSLEKVNNCHTGKPLDRHISVKTVRPPPTRPTQSASAGISATIRNIVSSIRSASEKNFGVACGTKSNSSTSSSTCELDNTARKPETVTVSKTSSGVAKHAKSNAVDRQTMYCRSYTQSSDQATPTWPANSSRPRPDPCIKKSGLKPQQKSQVIDSNSKCFAQNVCEEKQVAGNKHSGSVSSGSELFDSLNKETELLSALANVQNKILNQIDRTAKTMAKASVDQRKKADSEYGIRQSQYKIPKRSSADAPKHKIGGNEVAKPLSQKLEHNLVEKKLLEELRQKEKKLAEVMQEKAKLQAGVIKMDKGKYAPKLHAGKKFSVGQKSDAGKSKIAGAKMKMPLSFQQLFGDSLNYQGGTDQKEKKPASITNRRSKSTDSIDNGKAASIGKRRNTTDSSKSADVLRGGDTKTSPIIINESSNISGKSQGEKKAGAIVERHKSSNSTSSVSTVRSSHSHSSSKSHRGSSSDVSLPNSSHKDSDCGVNSQSDKTKHRHWSWNGNRGHGVKIHGHSSKHKPKESIRPELVSQGQSHSPKPERASEGASHPTRTDSMLEKVKPPGCKGKKDEKVPKSAFSLDSSMEPKKGKTFSTNKRSEDHVSETACSKKLADQLDGLQSGQSKAKKIAAQISKQSVKQKAAKMRGFEYPSDPVKYGSNLAEHLSRFIAEEVSAEERYACELHKTMTDCTVRLCKMPTLKTPVNLTPEVVKCCSPCDYSSLLISKLDKMSKASSDIKVEVSRKLLKSERLKDGLKSQQVGLTSIDDDVPLNTLLEKIRTPKKKKRRKLSVECLVKPTVKDLAKQVKDPSPTDWKISDDKLKESIRKQKGSHILDETDTAVNVNRGLVLSNDEKVSAAVELRKPNADKGRGRPDSDKTSKKRKKPDSERTCEKGNKLVSYGTCKESEKPASDGTCNESESHDSDITCEESRKPDSGSTCKKRKKPDSDIICKESKKPDPHSTCEETEMPDCDICKESEKPESGRFEAGLIVLNERLEINAKQGVLATNKDRSTKDAILDGNGNVIGLEACGMLMCNIREGIKDIGVVITDTCLDTTGSSDVSLEASGCMEIISSEDNAKKRDITTAACDKMVPLTISPHRLVTQPAVANGLDRDPGEKPSVEVFGTLGLVPHACEESGAGKCEGLLPDDVQVPVPEKELLRDVDEPKARAIRTESEIFVGPKSCSVYKGEAASSMKDLIGKMVCEIVGAAKENRRGKNNLSPVIKESIKPEFQTPSVSNDSSDVMNHTSNTVNSSSSEDRTILYGDSSYDFENYYVCGSQGMSSAIPEDEDEEIIKLLSLRKAGGYCQPESGSEIIADDFTLQPTPSTNPASPKDRDTAELPLDKEGSYLPDFKNVSSVQFDGDCLEGFPEPEAVMTPNSFKDAVANIVGSARKRSVSFALTQAPRNLAAWKMDRFHWTSSPADKTTLMSKLAFPARKSDEQKNGEEAMKFGGANGAASECDGHIKGDSLECSEYRTVSMAVRTSDCGIADHRSVVGTLKKAVESFEGCAWKKSFESLGDDTRSATVEILGVGVTVDKSLEVGTMRKADEASGGCAGTTAKIMISEDTAIQRKYSVGVTNENSGTLVTEPLTTLPEAVDGTRGPDSNLDDMQSTASITAQTDPGDVIAADPPQHKTTSDAATNLHTLKIHARSVARNSRIMFDTEAVQRNLPAVVVPFLSSLESYQATQEELKKLQSLELHKSTSDESKGINLVYYDDLMKILDECMKAQNPRGNRDVLKETDESKDLCKKAASMSGNIHGFRPETLCPATQNNLLIETGMNSVAGTQPGSLKWGSSLNSTKQSTNTNKPIVITSERNLQLPSPASFLLISQPSGSSLCPVNTCRTAAVSCVGVELLGRKTNNSAKQLGPGKLRFAPHKHQLLQTKTSQKQSDEQLAAEQQLHPAKTSRKQSVEQPAAEDQRHPAKTSRKQPVEQPAAVQQIHPAKTSRKQLVEQPAAEQQLHPAFKTSQKQSFEQHDAHRKASVRSKSCSVVIPKPDSRKTDFRKCGGPLKERKVSGVQRIGKQYFTDDDVTLFRERLSETLGEVVHNLQKRLSATDSSSAQDVFTNSDLSMHQIQNVCNPPATVIGQKRKCRKTQTSCARTHIPQTETIDNSQKPNSACYREDHLYQVRGRIEEAMDTASDVTMDDALENEESVKIKSKIMGIPVSSQSAKEKFPHAAGSPEALTPDGNVELERQDVQVNEVPTLGSLASKFLNSAGELSGFTQFHTSVVSAPTKESVPASILRAINAESAKILGRRKSDTDVAPPMSVANRCMSAAPLDTVDFTADETDGRVSRRSVERHFMQAFFPLAKVDEIERSAEEIVRIKQEGEDKPKDREYTEIRAAEAVQPISVLRLQDLVREQLIARRISFDSAMFDRVNGGRGMLSKTVNKPETRVDATSSEQNLTTSLAVDPADDSKRKEVFNDTVAELDMSHGLEFSFQTDKVAFIMPTPVDLTPIKDTSRDKHLSEMYASFPLVSTSTGEVFPSDSSHQVSGIEISSNEEHRPMPGEVSSSIDGDEPSKETVFAEANETCPTQLEKDSYGSMEAGLITNQQLEIDEGYEESEKKEKELPNEFEDSLHVNTTISSEGCSSSTHSGLFIDTDLDSSISTTDKAHFPSECVSPVKDASETVPPECDNKLQEAQHSIDGDDQEDSVNGNVENDILSCACHQVGLSAEDYESCSEETQTAADVLEAWDVFEQGQAVGVTDTHKESSQVGAIVLEERITEHCPISITGFVNSNDSIGPMLHLPDTGFQATVEKVKTKLTTQHQIPMVSNVEENSTLSALQPSHGNKNEMSPLSSGQSLVSTMEENSAFLTQMQPKSHRDDHLSNQQAFMSKGEDSSLSNQQPLVRDKEMCLAYTSQELLVRDCDNISTKDQSQKQETPITDIMTFRVKVINREPDKIETGPSAKENILQEASPLLHGVDVFVPSVDDMPLDLSKKRDPVVPRSTSHFIFHQSAVDLTVKKPEPSKRKWPVLRGLLDNPSLPDEPLAADNQQAGSQNACQVNRADLEVIDIPDCSPAKKCRTISQERSTGPSPIDDHLNQVISPRLPLPLETSHLNTNKLTEMSPQGENTLPPPSVLSIPRAPYGQWRIQSSGEGLLSKQAGSYSGPGSLIRGTFGAAQLFRNIATPSLGLYSNPSDTSPEYISGHLRNQVSPLQNATSQAFQNRFLTQNYIDVVNQQFLAMKAQNEKGVAPGPTRHQNLRSDVMLNTMPQGGSSDQMNNPMVAAQLKSSNPSHVFCGRVGMTANETGVDVKAKLSCMLQARTAGPDLYLRNAQSGVGLASVGLNPHTGPTQPGVYMQPNPSVPSSGIHRSPNFQGVRPELRQQVPYASPDGPIFPHQQGPMLGMGWNSPFLSNAAGFPQAYPYLYDTRHPSNESMQQRFQSPNLNTAIPGESPILPGSGQKKSPGLSPEIGMPTNLTIQAWGTQTRNMQGMNHQLSPNQMTRLVRFGNQSAGFPQYACSPQQSRMLTPPATWTPPERTQPLGIPAASIRHHLVAAQNYDLLHKDPSESLVRGALTIHPSAPAVESLQEQRTTRLVSQIPGSDQHKRDVTSTTFASHSPSKAAVSKPPSPMATSRCSTGHPVFSVPSPLKDAPVSASSMKVNQSPGKRGAVVLVAPSPDKQRLAQIRPDSTASLTPVGGLEHGVHDELLALKRQLEAERQSREKVQLELEQYKKRCHKKRKHHTGEDGVEAGQRKRHRSQETDVEPR